EGSYRAPEGAFLTMLAIGDESTFTVDVINHSDPGSQIPLGSFGAQATSVREEIAAAARALSLGARPNPSAGDARVHFTLATAGNVTLELYDALGRRVLTLADAHLAAGAHAVAIGGELEPGAYTAVLRAGEATAAAPVIVVR
ncbi:MAG TPA: T9SS type A sorting domain-containing protein, partial [Kofleriaceae bacterium]|nr:T9SS type A sorting domain-containing protein [Kofleriaceae bacterium]